MEIAELKKWTGFEFDSLELEMSQKDMLDCALACGETDPKFTDPDHEDFQAIPTFTAKFVGRRFLPEGFPRIGRGRGFDAGKTVVVKGLVRPGDVLTAKSQIADIYEKTGRSGQMVFIVHRMEFSNQRGEPVSLVDWRMVQLPEG